MTLARRLAEYAADLKFSDLNVATVPEVRRRLIDSLACVLGAYRADAVRIARRVGERTPCSSGVNLFGAAARTSPELAAFANGVAIRYLDYNDTYLSLEPAHPSDNLAAVLAASQLADADGKALVTAAVLAYEIQCRLCDAASIRARGWDHVTYGAFSSALAAGKLLGCSVDQLEQAVNLAGAPNITLRQTRSGELSHWKGCAFANVGRNGLFAALLAVEGLSGPAPIFEGEMGFFRQVSGEFDLPFLNSEGRPTDFMINRTSIKFWPAEYHSQSAIHAALELRKEISDPAKIKKIDVYSFDAAVDIIGKDPEKWRPKTRETADHSLPYCAAVALFDGDVSLASFDRVRLHDRSLLELVSKVSVHRDDALTARYPRGIPNRLVVTLDDGRRLECENEFPRGHAENRMSDQEIEAKFRRLAVDVLDEAQVSGILEQCRQMENWDNVDELFQKFPTS